MASFGPRNGQWVKFKVAKLIPGGHVSADGYYVGIYRAPTVLSTVVHKIAEATGVAVPEAAEERVEGHIMLVDPEGYNVPRFEKGAHLGNWSFKLDEVNDLQPVTDRAHIPAERIKHLPDDWQPRR